VTHGASKGGVAPASSEFGRVLPDSLCKRYHARKTTQDRTCLGSWWGAHRLGRHAEFSDDPIPPLWLPRGFANFPKKTNFLIEVFPFRGLLIVWGSLTSKSVDRCFQSGKRERRTKVGTPWKCWSEPPSGLVLAGKVGATNGFL